MKTFAAIVCALALKVVAADVPLADPFVLYDGGVYYAYGTGAKDGIPVMTSTDLVDWKREPRLALHRDDSFGDKNFWAPEVYKVRGGYVMCYTAEERVCFALAKSPLGPFRQREKKPVFDFGSIDGHLFRDDDGKVWLFFVKFEGGNVIYQVEMERNLKGHKPETMRRVFGADVPWELVDARVTEGPFVVKVDGTYILTYSANHYRSQDYAVGVATARSIEGPWTKYAGNPILRRRFGLVGTGHHALFKDAEGEWKIVFHSHNSHEKINPRVMHIADIHFHDAGGITVPDVGKLVKEGKQ